MEVGVSKGEGEESGEKAKAKRAKPNDENKKQVCIFW